MWDCDPHMEESLIYINRADTAPHTYDIMAHVLKASNYLNTMRNHAIAQY